MGHTITEPDYDSLSETILEEKQLYYVYYNGLSVLVLLYVTRGAYLKNGSPAVKVHSSSWLFHQLLHHLPCVCLIEHA